MHLEPGKKIYFASDFHLGAPNDQKSAEREKRIIAWLDYIEPTAQEIYLVGDIFDFWFEYKRAIPKGFVRLQGKIAQLTDKGIPVHLFTGNHDMWIFDYIPKELGVKLYREPQRIKVNNLDILIGHGDGLGPGDRNYKLLKKVFNNPLCQWAFERLHPNFGIWLADLSSKKSRASGEGKDEVFHGKEDEWLYLYASQQQLIKPIDYYIFGHRHLPLTMALPEKGTYINLGEWLKYDTFAILENDEIKLYQWKENQSIPFEENNY